MEYFFKEINSPVGRLKLVASDKGLAAILWENDDPRRVRVRDYTEKNDHPLLLETERQLREYFEGRRTVFSVGLDMIGTSFQQKVWSALLTIPYGETRSYGDIVPGRDGCPADGWQERKTLSTAAGIGNGWLNQLIHL